MTLPSSARSIFEIPATADMDRPIQNFRETAHRSFTSSLNQRARLPAFLPRIGALIRARISPEGHCLAEAKNLSRSLIRAGRRLFAISYHNPSLAPGKTAYTGTHRNIERFLSWIEKNIEFSTDKFGGASFTPGQILDLARRQVVADVRNSSRHERMWYDRRGRNVTSGQYAK